MMILTNHGRFSFEGLKIVTQVHDKILLEGEFYGLAQMEVYENPRYLAASLPPFVSFVRFCLPLKGLQKITKATKRKYPRPRILSRILMTHDRTFALYNIPVIW